MDELFKILGLDEDSPTAEAVSVVKRLQQDLEDKTNIIAGMQEQISNYEEQIDSIASGVADARVKDLVNKVQSETGYYVGKDHIETLQRKAAQHLYATDDKERDSIWKDMKAHSVAYGAKLSLNERLKSLHGKRQEGETEADRDYSRAQELINSGEAKGWEEANKMVIREKENRRKEEN